MVGLEPTIPGRRGGFKDRCVYQFHHIAIIEGDGAASNRQPEDYKSSALPELSYRHHMDAARCLELRAASNFLGTRIHLRCDGDFDTVGVSSS